MSKNFNKNKSVFVRITEDELIKIKKAVKKRQFSSISEWCRLILLDASNKELNSKSGT